MDETHIRSIKDSITIQQAWQILGLSGEPRRTGCHSPFREDKNPSFSIYGDDRRWKDHATGEGGDVIDFAMAACNVDFRGAVEALSGGSFVVFRPPATPRRSPLFEVDMGEIKRWKAQEPYLPILTEFARIKRIGEIMRYVEEGSITSTFGKVAFLFDRGVKVRHDIQTSRSCRWATGKGNDNLWRIPHFTRQRGILIVEGETDTMAAQNVADKVLGAEELLVCGAPGAGWMPNERIRARLRVLGVPIVLAFDGDEAGRRGAEKLAGEIGAKIVPTPESMDFCEMDDRDRADLISRVMEEIRA